MGTESQTNSRETDLVGRTITHVGWSNNDPNVLVLVLDNGRTIEVPRVG